MSSPTAKNVTFKKACLNYSRNTFISHAFYLPKGTLETIFHTASLHPKLFLTIILDYSYNLGGK